MLFVFVHFVCFDVFDCFVWFVCVRLLFGYLICWFVLLVTSLFLSFRFRFRFGFVSLRALSVLCGFFFIVCVFSGFFFVLRFICVVRLAFVFGFACVLLYVHGHHVLFVASLLFGVVCFACCV